MRPIRPITDFGSRVPEAGKIRLGIKVPTKNGKERPAAIDTFRFTSPHQDLIEQLAAVYGGTPRPWDDAKASVHGQWEVLTEAKTIDVYLPPGGLSQHYELWAGSGCVRRCNGISCEVPSRSPDGGVDEVPCLCIGNQKMECVPQTRLSLVLPDIAFRGTWTLSSKSWNAAEELVGMERMINSIQDRVDIVKAQLHLQERTRVTSQGKKNFVVPVMTLASSPEALAAGTTGLAAPSLAAPAAAALPAASADDDVAVTGDADDDVVDAEVVWTAEDVAELACDLANTMILDPHGLLTGVCRGISRRSGGAVVDTPEELGDVQLAAAMEFLMDVRDGRIEVMSIADGNLTIKRIEAAR